MRALGCPFPSLTTRLLFILAAAALPIRAAPETPQAIATEILAPLLDPAKVATLKGDRPANARLYKVLYWLENGTQGGAMFQLTARYTSVERQRQSK